MAVRVYPGADYEECINGEFMPGGLRFEDLHNRYVASQFGLHHDGQPARYSQNYGYDRSLMIEDLGDDVHPVRHMPYTESRLARPLMVVQNVVGDERFDPGQIVAVRMAALLHDTGECEHPLIQDLVGHTVGDISWELKAQADGDKETLIRQYLYEQLYPDVPADLLCEADDVIDYKEGSLPREAFNTVERLGYYTTAIRAGERALSLLEMTPPEIEPAPRVVQLGRLALRVSNDHRGFLQGRSERFPYLDEVLKASVPVDDRIQTELPFLRELTPQAA